jgi:threonine dehydrogenase-like Zn-dependent dehydrogenase
VGTVDSISTSKAMLLVEPRHMASTRLPLRHVESGGWLAVEATGISGWDVQTWKGEHSDLVYPLIPGNQVVGRIAHADESIPFEVGARVLVEPEIRCGECVRCKNGVAGCRRRRPANAYGRLPSSEPPGLWGGLAEYLYLDPACRLHAISDDTPAEVATCAHQLAAGRTWAVELPELAAGESVLIMGPGPRGIGCLLAAQAAGAGWIGITGLDTDHDRLELAGHLGADLAVNVSIDDAGQAVADNLGTRPDVVIDVTSDDPEAVFAALELVRTGGRVVLASLKGRRPLHFLTDVIVSKQLTLRGALGASTESYEWACRMVESDPRVDDLVSHQFPLAEADRAIQAAAGLLGREELFSVAVTF